MMPILSVTPDVEANPWKDLQRDDVVHVTSGIRVGGLPGGMGSGKASVAITFDLPDGRPVLVETSLELFLMAASVLRARYENNNPRGGDA
jgi:hypothetical protein